MKKTQAWLALLLAAAVLMGMLPLNRSVRAEEIPVSSEPQPQPEVSQTPAQENQAPTAQEESRTPAEPDQGTWTWLNPALPEDMISETAPADTTTSQPQATSDYITEEEAVKELRKMLRNRVSSETMYVLSEKNIPSRLFNSLANRALEHTGEPDEGDYLLWTVGQIAMGYDSHPHIEIDGVEYIIYEIIIECTYLTTASQEDSVDYAVSRAVRNLGVSDKSDYEKVCAVYDYLCENVTYLAPPTSYEPLSYTAYGAMMDKAATSHGIASLAYRMLLELDVDNRVLGGAMGDYEHCWNIVVLDELYYNMDAALDAGSAEYQWFLKGVLDFPDHARYSNYATVAFCSEYPVAAEAYNPDVPGVIYPYIAAGMCGDAAYWAVQWDGVLVVFGEGRMNNYSREVPWDFWVDEIVEVYVDEGITYIGEKAFYRHYKAKKATVYTTKIGSQAFRGCSGLKEVILMEGVVEIADSAFYSCTKLETIEFPSSLKLIGSRAFSGCYGLTEITIPDTVEKLDSLVFEYCSNLTRAYVGCKEVGWCAFSGASLTELTLSDTVTKIGNDAFAGSDFTEVVFPDSIVSMSGFENCKNLKKVVLPKNLEVLDYDAFRGCTSLEEVVLPDTLKEIGSYAFADCTSLKTLDIPKGVQTIHSHVFSGCENLETIWFHGDAPQFDYTFEGVTVTAYYPEDNDTWSEIVKTLYPNNVTWVPYHVCYEGEIRDAVEPTCDKDGYTGDTYCVKCGELMETGEVIPATGHTWGEWEVTQEPTEDTPGAKRRHCAVCGAQEDRHIPATGTVFGDANGDGEINGKDLILLRQRLAGWEVEQVARNADCNGDGTVNGKDLILLRQHLAGWDVPLGPTE